MAGKKKIKKKCCGKFVKKGKHCSSCPITGNPKKCADDKDYCKACQVPSKSMKPKDKRQDQKNGEKQDKKKSKTKGKKKKK
jgi:hypothetical protein